MAGASFRRKRRARTKAILDCSACRNGSSGWADSLILSPRRDKEPSCRLKFCWNRSRKRRCRHLRPCKIPMKNPEKIRILIADDHYVVRIGLAALISVEADMEVVA